MDLLAVGVVTSPHGVRGEVRVKSFSGSIENWKKLRDATLGKGGERRAVHISSLRSVSGGALVRIEGCDSPEAARKLVGWELWVEREYACSLSAGEYYTADLCRCSVFHRGKRIGGVLSIIDAGSRQLLEISVENGRTVLVPFIERFFGTVDIDAGRIELTEEDILE
jgi:16S rRNA processing protein RimM